MDLEFQNIEENGAGKMFASMAEESLPVGQMFYNIDNLSKQIIVNHVYIPRKYWTHNGIRESMFAEMQNLYPEYSIAMKGSQKEASLLKESPARSKAQFRYMQGICNGSIEPPKGMTRAKACEFVEGQKDYKELPDKKSNRRQTDPKTNKPLIRDFLDIEEPTDVIRSDEELNSSNLDFAEKEKIRRIRERLRREKAEKKKEQEDPEFIYMPYSEGKGGPLRRQDMRLRRLDNRRKNFGPGNNPKIDRADHIAKWKVTKKYTHLNSEGKPCNCGFYKPDYKESAWKIILASKLDKIIKDDPKVLRTDEGKKVLEWMKGLPEQVDDLLPWMVREYKKRRLAPAIAGDAVVGMERVMQQESDLDEIADGTLLLDGQTLSHWADWFNSNSPTRRGVDIMQLTTEQFQDKVSEWDQELADKMEEAIVYEGAGKVVYAFPDGWTMREVAPEECGDEGAQMGHCVGSHGYADAIRRGDIKIISLRDPENKPHATLEVKSNGHVEQIQGKQNVHPISAYRRKIRTFIDDPQGFQNLFGTKAIQEEGYPTRNWSQLGEDIGYYDLPEKLQAPALVEEEFGPEWNDPYAENHPAGTSSYSRGLRGTHYGIMPGGTSIDYDSFLMRTDDSSPTLINKLYEIAERRGEIPLLERALNNQEEKREVNPNSLYNTRGLLVLPNFEDQSRDGWRDVFEKETGIIDYTTFSEGPERDRAEKEYKAGWNNWIQNLYSADYEKLLNNLVRINKYKNQNEEQVARSINTLLANTNLRNQLRSLINKTEMGDPFSSLRPSFGLDPTVQEEQLSLISKWKPLKKKIAMPKNPEELQESEIITDEFVKNTRLKAFQHGFRDGFTNGWRDGIATIRNAIGDQSVDPNRWGQQYGIDNKSMIYRNVLPTQMTFPKTLKEISESRIDQMIENSRKDLNTAINLVPSNFLKDGRKYTPSGKQFSKKKFIETLVDDYKTMIKMGYQVAFEKAQEKAYTEEEIRANVFYGPESHNIYNEAVIYMDPMFLEKLEEMDAETFAYSEDRRKVFDETDWDKIYKKEVSDDSYRKRWYPTVEKYKESEMDNRSYQRINSLEKLKEILKNREDR